MDLYVVVKAVVRRDGSRLLPGQLIPGDSPGVDSLLARGLVTKQGEPLPEQKPLKRAYIRQLVRTSTSEADARLQEAEERREQKIKARHNGHRWNVDPDTIKDCTLEQLNILVLERDSSVVPFQTSAEARAWLSKDYVEL